MRTPSEMSLTFSNLIIYPNFLSLTPSLNFFSLTHAPTSHVNHTRLLHMSTTRATRFLKSVSNTDSPSENADAVDSDFVVILAALLCALICVLGLVAVARCAWLRRFTVGATGSPPPANKGLKKKVLKSLPKVPYSPENHAGKLGDDCAICLSEFVSGEEILVLPQCGHGFHVTCIDTWLGSHSSCPLCRQILGVASVSASARCQKCGGGLPESGAACSSSSSSSSQQAPPTATALEVGDRFLP